MKITQHGKHFIVRSAKGKSLGVYKTRRAALLHHRGSPKSSTGTSSRAGGSGHNAVHLSNHDSPKKNRRSHAPTRITGPLTERTQLVYDYRLAHPKSRAVDLFRFTKNTGASKRMGCVLCGEDGPSWSAEYRKTKRACEWEVEHAKKHVKDSPKKNRRSRRHSPSVRPTAGGRKKAGTKTITYDVHGLDVWGNKKDGYEVNDVYPSRGNITVPVDASDQEIVAALKAGDFVARNIRHTSVRIEGDRDFHLDIEDRFGKPAYQLRARS